MTVETSDLVGFSYRRTRSGSIIEAEVFNGSRFPSSWAPMCLVVPVLGGQFLCLVVVRASTQAGEGQVSAVSFEYGRLISVDVIGHKRIDRAVEQ